MGQLIDKDEQRPRDKAEIGPADLHLELQVAKLELRHAVVHVPVHRPEQQRQRWCEQDGVPRLQLVHSGDDHTQTVERGPVEQRVHGHQVPVRLHGDVLHVLRQPEGLELLGDPADTEPRTSGGVRQHHHDGVESQDIPHAPEGDSDSKSQQEEQRIAVLNKNLHESRVHELTPYLINILYIIL